MLLVCLLQATCDPGWHLSCHLMFCSSVLYSQPFFHLLSVLLTSQQIFVWFPFLFILSPHFLFTNQLWWNARCWVPNLPGGSGGGTHALSTVSWIPESVSGSLGGEGGWSAIICTDRHPMPGAQRQRYMHLPFTRALLLAQLRDLTANKWRLATW